jgi:hypothetical protein
MASKKRTWLWIILGVMGTLALLVVVLVGTAIYQFRQHVRSDLVESRTAEQEFDRQRAQFTGQQPLIETTEDKGDRSDRTTIHHPPADAARVEIHTLRVLVYDFNQGRLTHADVPGWLLRAMRNRAMRTAPRPESGFNTDFDFGTNSGLDRSGLTIADLERHGLGLVMDSRNRQTRILIWTE